MKVKLIRKMLMRSKEVYLSVGHLRRWGTLFSKPISPRLNTGRGFYKEVEGKQNKEIKGKGLRVLY